MFVSYLYNWESYAEFHLLMFALFMFGLSIERPILDHHPKAHIHEIRRISP